MSQPAIAAFNAGSSSLKFALFSAEASPARLIEGEVAGLLHTPTLRVQDACATRLVERGLGEGTGHEAAISAVLAWIAEHGEFALVGAGHRIVHGGRRYRAPVRIDASVLAELEALTPLAPLHQPPALAAVRALARRSPLLAQVACFDTAFHHTQPDVARAFALPRALSAEGIERYGFHGLSYEYIAGVLPDWLDAPDGRVIVAHLGSGASLCALHNRRSVATTMGFTPLDGLPMSRRCGSIDPGVLLYLLQAKGMNAETLTELLYQRSGLLGVSDLSDDMRELLASTEPAAAQAVALFVYRTVLEIGALSAALGGLDALVFTAGIGEHAALVRERICASLGWLGLTLDQAANARGTGRISTAQSAVSAWVIATDEDLMVARHTAACLTGAPTGNPAR